MSTFDGRIKEYPTISIDNFTTNGFSKYYLLSHVHSDHLKGLDEHFKGTIYLSEQSAKLLPLLTERNSNRLKYPDVEKYLVPIPYNKRFTINTPEYEDLHLTFLPANHCLGSSLILIECKRKGSVLYTGDIRAEEEFVKRELSVISQHRIQNLYMDTTCCYEDRMNYIPKRKSIELLIKKMKSLDAYHHIYLDFWQLGYEEAWKAVYDAFKTKIHVAEEKYNLYCAADPSFADILTTDPSCTRFHSCRWNTTCSIHGKYTITIHPVPTINQEMTVYNPKIHKKLLQSDLDNGIELKQQLILPFSTHSSCSEIAAFYKFVRPKLFIACIVRGDFYGRLSDIKNTLTRLGCEIGDIELSQGSTYSTDASSSKRPRSTESETQYSTTLPDNETFSTDNSSSAGNTARISTLLMDTTNRSNSVVRSPNSPKRNTQLSKSIEPKSQASQGLKSKEAKMQASQGSTSNAQANQGPSAIAQTNQGSNLNEQANQGPQSIEQAIQGEETLPLVFVSQFNSPELVREQENCIVISSDEEDDLNKPLLTKSLFRQFKRKLKRCKYTHKEPPEEIPVRS